MSFVGKVRSFSFFSVESAIVVLLSFQQVPVAFSATRAETAPWIGNSSRHSVPEADHFDSVDISPFSPDSNNISIDLGQVFLMGSSPYKDTLGMKLHYTYGVSETFGFDAAFGYSNHSDGAYNLMSVTAGLRANLAWYDKIVPNIVLGLGFFRPSIRLGEGQNAPSVAPILFGMHIGPGIDLMLTNRFFFGTSITFHNMFGTSVAAGGQNVDVGGSFTTFYLKTGMTF